MGFRIRDSGFRGWGFQFLPIVLALLAGCSGKERSRAAAPASDTVTAVDDAGRVVRLAHPARRVVSLLPAGTETLFALGAGDAVVGRTRYDRGERVADLPSVG
ncbi:MAG TPA: hypothetical protein VFI96_08525, partial [Longimicrobiaceae bacterium]|nr:hypothetical protein [Longimicrobiaceae bacterium]